MLPVSLILLLSHNLLKTFLIGGTGGTALLKSLFALSHTFFQFLFRRGGSLVGRIIRTVEGMRLVATSMAIMAVCRTGVTATTTVTPAMTVMTAVCPIGTARTVRTELGRITPLLQPLQVSLCQCLHLLLIQAIALGHIQCHHLGTQFQAGFRIILTFLLGRQMPHTGKQHGQQTY